MRSIPVVALLAVSACVTEAEYESVLAERDGFRARIAKLEDEVDQSKGEIKQLKKELKAAQADKPSGPSVKIRAAAYSQLQLGQNDDIFATLETSLGNIRCELFPTFAPNTVMNFVGLAEGTKEWTDPESGQKTVSKLYDGTTFHRVIKGFLIQGGDPIGNGRGGPGYSFPNEVWSHVRFDRPGVLAMASTGGVSNGSQFFITDGRPLHLNGQNTIFGLCDVETVRKIMEVETEGPEKATPVEPVTLKKVTIERVHKDE